MRPFGRARPKWHCRSSVNAISLLATVGLESSRSRLAYLNPVRGDIMAAEIRLFTCLTDNFGYLIHDPATKATASIDAPEAGPIIKALEREGWALTDILITHHHHDHVGGVAELKQKYACRVVAPHDKSTKIANADARVKEGDAVKVGDLTARVLETPATHWITSAMS